MGANTLGVDAAESNIGIATAHALADPGLSSLTYKHGAVENLLEEPKQYDVVCSMEVLEHVDSPKQFISTLCQLVKVWNVYFVSGPCFDPSSLGDTSSFRLFLGHHWPTHS